MIDRYLKVEGVVTRLAINLAAALLAVAAALAIWQVWTRYVMGQPSTWSEVATRSLMIWAVFLAAPYGFRHGAMIAVELSYRMVPRRLLVWAHTVVAICSLIFLTVLAWQGYNMMLRVQSQTLAGLFISIAYVYAAIPVGAVLSIFAVIGRMFVVARAPEDNLLIVDATTSAT